MLSKGVMQHINKNIVFAIILLELQHKHKWESARIFELALAVNDMVDSKVYLDLGV